MNPRQLQVVDPQTLGRVAADIVVRYAQDAIVDRGRAAIALCGGRTVEPIFRLLARPPHTTRLDFSAIHFFFADERCVPPADPQSNFKLADDLLLAPVGTPPGNVHRIRGELAPADAAADYQAQLATFFEMPPAGPPPALDLVVLGLGQDGHVASLFPRSPGEPHRLAVDAAAGAWVVATRSPAGVAGRVSLSLATLNAARNVLIIAAGEGKADAARRVLREDEPLPAGRIDPARTIWLLDTAAAAGGVA